MGFKCKENCGECCGCVPIPTPIWNKNKDKIQTEIKESFITEVYVYPVTEDLKCCFLTKDKKCAIYEERPNVCQRYGLCDELTCPYFKKNGNLWSEAKAKQIRKKIDRDVDFAMKIVEQKMEVKKNAKNI